MPGRRRQSSKKCIHDIPGLSEKKIERAYSTRETNLIVFVKQNRTRSNFFRDSSETFRQLFERFEMKFSSKFIIMRLNSFYNLHFPLDLSS